MNIVAWLRKVQDALHKRAEAIRYSEERKRNQQLPADKPIEINAVVSFSDKTVRDAQSENDRAHATQTSIKNATWAAFIAASIYALIAVSQTCQMIKATNAAQTSANTAAKELELDERPWIKVSDPLLDPKEPMVLGKNGEVFANVRITVKNIGKTLATEVLTEVALGGSGTDFGLVKELCEKKRPVPQRFLGPYGQILFPQDILYPQTDYSAHGHALQLTSNEYEVPMSLVGCVRYKSAVSDELYYTGFIYTISIQDNPEGIVMGAKFEDGKVTALPTRPKGSPVLGKVEAQIPPRWFIFFPSSVGNIVK